VGEDVGKRNPHTLLVGMQASTTTMENNMEAFQKTKHRSPSYEDYTPKINAVI
jgi:hypothetical protein